MAVDILSDIKALKKISDTSKDAEINIYIRRAVTLIKEYLNLGSNDTTDIENIYPDACIAYVMEQFQKGGNEGIKQFTQGSRSVTYSNTNNGLSDNVTSLLPVPYARMMG